MNKTALVRRVAEANPHLTLHDTEFIVATIFDVITVALLRGDRGELRRFGVFTVRKRDAHMARNPRTGNKVAIGEKRVPLFKTGKVPTTDCKRTKELMPTIDSIAPCRMIAL